MRKSSESDKELEGSHDKLANLSRDCKLDEEASRVSSLNPHVTCLRKFDV